MKYVIASFLSIAVVSCSISSEKPPKQGRDEPIKSVKMKIDSSWPSLPTTGFIKGRPATEQDIDDGNAVFVASGPNGKVLGQPIDIDIPQYAE